MKKNSATIHMVNKEKQCSYGICCSIAMRISIYKNVYIYIYIYRYVCIHINTSTCRALQFIPNIVFQTNINYRLGAKGQATRPKSVLQAVCRLGKRPVNSTGKQYPIY